MDERKVYKIALDPLTIEQFRRTFNDLPKSVTRSEYCKKHYNAICACMDRITDIVRYLNEKELGAEKQYNSAFAFIEFIAQASVLIGCIAILAKKNHEGRKIRY